MRGRLVVTQVPVLRHSSLDEAHRSRYSSPRQYEDQTLPFRYPDVPLTSRSEAEYQRPGVLLQTLPVPE